MESSWRPDSAWTTSRRPAASTSPEAPRRRRGRVRRHVDLPDLLGPFQLHRGLEAGARVVEEVDADLDLVVQHREFGSPDLEEERLLGFDPGDRFAGRAPLRDPARRQTRRRDLVGQVERDPRLALRVGDQLGRPEDRVREVEPHPGRGEQREVVLVPASAARAAEDVGVAVVDLKGQGRQGGRVDDLPPDRPRAALRLVRYQDVLIGSFQAFQRRPSGPSTWNSASDVRYQPRKSRSPQEGVRDASQDAAMIRLSALFFWSRTGPRSPRRSRPATGSARAARCCPWTP